MKIAVAHDYLLQYGGAERVVAAWLDRLPASSVFTLAYDQNRTFVDFQNININATLRGHVARTKIEYLLPLLPIYATKTRVQDADVAVVSTSGWAHQFTYDMPTVAYVHSPARWLYERVDYARKLGYLGKLGLAASSKYLISQDRPSMMRMTRVLTNSKISQSRVKRAYGISSEVLHPPVGALIGCPRRPSKFKAKRFALIVSRNRGYKNIPLALEAAKRAGVEPVVVGGGSEVYDAPRERVFGLGRVSDSELKWLYQHAAVVIGSSHEDFGLTVLEANLEGTPSAVIPVGGYLETVKNGVNGYQASTETVEELSKAVLKAIDIPSKTTITWAEGFSPEQHMQKLMAVVNEVAF